MVMFFICNAVYAGYAGSLDVNRIRVHENSTYFATSPQLANTCSNWGEFFKFDHRTETGKAYLSLLITAKTTGQKIQLWYSESTAPGSDQTSGCVDKTLSVISGAALQ
jgi:hypothetical protein